MALGGKEQPFSPKVDGRFLMYKEKGKKEKAEMHINNHHTFAYRVSTQIAPENSNALSDMTGKNVYWIKSYFSIYKLIILWIVM